MLGFTALLHPPIPIPFSIPSIPIHHYLNNCTFPSLPIKTQTQNPRNPRRRLVVVYAENGNGGSKDSKEREEDDGYSVGNDLKGDRRPIFTLRWGDLLYPNPDNILAVGLTGLLTWASVQVLWQLFFISLAIIVSALKYSFIAAVLLFILVTLL